MRRSYKPRLRATVAQNAAYLKAMGASATDIDAIHARTQQYLPKQRAPRTEPRISDPALTEAPVIQAVAQLLARHPKVLFAVRQNGGAFTYEKADGRSAPVWFYKIITTQDCTISDFWGILRDGRLFAIEAKRPSWKKPSNEREYRQWAFVKMVQNLGGVGGFVRSADEAAEILR